MGSGVSECPECGKGFDSPGSMKKHKAQVHSEKKWRDEEYLREQYTQKKNSIREIAEELDTSQRTISKYLDKYGIEKRSHSESIKNHHRHAPAPFFTGTHGYEFWRTSYEGEDYTVKHHRLLAVAEYGYNAVVGMSIHHKNGIEWDNRPENIELLTRSEHSKRHYEDSVYARENATTKDRCEEYREKYEHKTCPEIAEEYDVRMETVWYHVAERCKH